MCVLVSGLFPYADESLTRAVTRKTSPSIDIGRWCTGTNVCGWWGVHVGGASSEYLHTTNATGLSLHALRCSTNEPTQLPRRPLASSGSCYRVQLLVDLHKRQEEKTRQVWTSFADDKRRLLPHFVGLLSCMCKLNRCWRDALPLNTGNPLLTRLPVPRAPYSIQSSYSSDLSNMR